MLVQTHDARQEHPTVVQPHRRFFFFLPHLLVLLPISQNKFHDSPQNTFVVLFFYVFLHFLCFVFHACFKFFCFSTTLGLAGGFFIATPHQVPDFFCEAKHYGCGAVTEFLAQHARTPPLRVLDRRELAGPLFRCVVRCHVYVCQYPQHCPKPGQSAGSSRPIPSCRSRTAWMRSSQRTCSHQRLTVMCLWITSCTLQHCELVQDPLIAVIFSSRGDELRDVCAQGLSIGA